MADNAHDTAHEAAHAGSHANHGDHGDHEEHAEHPGWSIYWKVALILTIITAVEVSAFYIPAWETSWIYVPSMLIMSTVKFVIVVMFYMHLKYDHKLFRSLFTGPLIIAALTLLGLLFLFGQLSVRLGLLTS
ncbi:MAG: cytochrome C oxidase subunit IV family protein [Gemmatimonadota bacterium]